MVKVNAVERLRAELASKKWQGDHIAMGTNTDPYQRCEGKYRLTRGIIQELGVARNPFSILTKGTLILRDLDVLTEAAKRTDVRANFSIGTLDEAVWRTSEPGTPHPRKRVEAVAKLNEAGIPCGVLVAPILPGHLRRARADRGGRQGGARGGRGVGVGDSAAPAERRPRAVHAVARRDEARSGRALRPDVPRRVRTQGRAGTDLEAGRGDATQAWRRAADASDVAPAHPQAGCTDEAGITAGAPAPARVLMPS